LLASGLTARSTQDLRCNNQHHAAGATPGTVAVQRALAVLRAFESAEVPLRLSEIARATSLSASTTHRLLSALCVEGFLSQDPDTERYRLGPVLVLLGQQGARDAGLHEAQTVLSELTSSTGESATLAVRAGAEAVVMAVSPSPQRLRFDYVIGSRIVLHASGMGKVLLACAGADLADEVRSLGPLQRFTERTITSHSKLVTELRIVRSLGWATNHQERYAGVGGIAAPVTDTAGRVFAAVGVQGPSLRLHIDDDRDLVASVVAAGARLSGHLNSSVLCF
jgi:IclR family transcriptional regulator, acetate operon repressor